MGSGRLFWPIECQPLFNTPCFLFIFLPAVLIVYWMLASQRQRLAIIIVSGFVFYSFWDVRFTLLLLSAAVVDFIVGLRIGLSPRKKLWLAVSLVFNLGVLAFFKYAMFAAENARTLLALVGSPLTIPHFSIVLPVGISFFTFKTLSYTIDVYRGHVPPTRDFLKYLAFISLFPELVAGPIVRWSELKDQLDAVPRRAHPSLFAIGATCFVAGLFKKVIIADSVARLIEPYWSSPLGLTTAAAWSAALGYTLQLYFDFAGYSDMAIGLGAMLGFRFPINFRAPYQARNPQDFWRRWHVSLSRWLRDYLYIPLGGSRHGKGRTLLSLIVVMLLGGLWHGAAWTFVIWGAYHGVLLMAYGLTAKRWDMAPIALQRAAMLLLVVAGWVLFRAPDVSTAGAVLASMFWPTTRLGWLLTGPALALLLALVTHLVIAGAAERMAWLRSRTVEGMTAATVPLVPVGWLIASTASTTLTAFAALFAFVWFARPTTEMEHRFTPWRAVMIGAALAATLVFLDSEPSPFLYYQF